VYDLLLVLAYLRIPKRRDRWDFLFDFYLLNYMLKHVTNHIQQRFGPLKLTLPKNQSELNLFKYFH
jgi:hypothetical protein